MSPWQFMPTSCVHRTGSMVDSPDPSSALITYVLPLTRRTVLMAQCYAGVVSDMHVMCLHLSSCSCVQEHARRLALLCELPVKTVWWVLRTCICKRTAPSGLPHRQSCLDGSGSICMQTNTVPVSPAWLVSWALHSWSDGACTVRFLQHFFALGRLTALAATAKRTHVHCSKCQKPTSWAVRNQRGLAGGTAPANVRA